MIFELIILVVVTVICLGIGYIGYKFCEWVYKLW